MAEVKNAFIKSKMNKDLEARLLPQGEYRDAVNIQVSKSEGDDVGALENVLGNISIADFANDSGVANIECIGYFVDEFNSTIYLFFTDYTDTNTEPTYSPTANNFIYAYNTITTGSGITKLVEGAFLNFSTTSPVIGVNILEDFLFFTDNRNQPRKINVTLANQGNVANPTYYSTEDDISVAKYYPYEPISVYKLSQQSAAIATADVDGATTASSTIDVDNISGNIVPGMVVQGSGVDNGVFVVSFSSPTVTINKNQTLADNTALTFTSYETSMYDASSATLPDGTTNPYYESTFPGDPQFLEDKFIRFSYRFKFVDGEYSLIAPFTQPCFIPKQDGYFIAGDEEQAFTSTIVDFMENKVDKINLQVPLPVSANSLESDFHISEVDIIYKESDGLALQVVETIPVSEISSSSGSSQIYEYSYLSQKPYKTLPENEIVRVYDKIPVKALGQEIISNRVVYSNFQDKHTPPAFINYQVAASEKFSSISTVQFPALSRVEYPNHSLKENRNYQVGVVLSDKYGRQSTTILSNNIDATPGGFGADTIYLPYRSVNDSISFAGDSLKVLFNDFISSTKNSISLTPGLYNGDEASSDYNPTGWYTYKIVVKQIEQEYYNVYTAGAMKGLPYDYNISFPGQPGGSNNTSFLTLINDNINKVPRDLTEVGPQDKSFRSSVRLFGRVNNTANVFSNTGNEQYIPTDSRLSFTTNVIEDLFDLFDVLQFDFGPGTGVEPITSTDNPFHGFFKSDSNPFIAEFITTQTTADQFGVENDYNTTTPSNEFKDIENLAILETSPVVSRLDIFYETTTAGLISDLNIAIGEDTGGAFGVSNFTYTHEESDAPGTVIANEFSFLDILNNVVTPSSLPTIVSVIDNSGSGINRASEFNLVQGATTTTYDLKTAAIADGSVADAYFYYGSTAATLESYTFTFSVTTGSTTSLVQATGSLANNNPSIDNSNASPITVSNGAVSILTNITGKNGSNTSNPTTSVYTQGLTFSIAASTGAGTYIIVGSDVENTDASANGTGTFTLRVTDAGGATADKVFTVIFGAPAVDTQFSGQTYILNDADGAAIWFTNDVVSLTANTPSYLSGSTGPPLYTYGIQAPSALNTTINDRICAIGQNLNATFQNKTTSGGLTQGTFYVLVRARNLRLTSVSGAQNSVNVRWAMSYRANSSGCPLSCWNNAVDILGNSIGASEISSTFRYNNLSATGYAEGYDNTSNDGLDANNIPYGQTGITVRNVNTASAPAPEGALVYAFNTVGEYRLVIGNLQSTYGAMQDGYLNCSNTQDPDVEADYEIGDFNYPSSSWAGDGDGIYEYRIATSSNCSVAFSNTSTVYYAKEPFAKYLTQLYTDVNLTTPATISGTGLRYRRMETRGSSTVSNPEYTVEGAYIGYFNNGLKAPGSLPCLW